MMVSAAKRETMRHAEATLTIDLAAVRRNYRLLVDKVGPHVTCAGVVKANAYGLGADRVAPALYDAGCRSFFVAHLDEGLDLLRHLASDVSIFVLNGLPKGGETDCAHAGLLPVVNSLEQHESWKSCALRLGRCLPAAVQFDSGMSRMGMSRRELDAFEASEINVRLVMSHLACADTPLHPANPQQLAMFRDLAARFPTATKSLANSSGIFLGADYHYGLVRPGAALYGINPQPTQPNPMSAVVKISAQVTQMREIEAGAHVGYGWAFRAAKFMRLATLSIGYADGLHRALGSGGAAYFRGHRLAITGRVSMDSITVDVSDLPRDALISGSEIELVGQHQSIDDLAAAAGTIGYELLAGLGHRYQRTYLNETSDDARRHVHSGSIR